MEEQPNWLPKSVDITKPSAARVYDAFLGGTHNFPVDRQFTQDAERVFPGVATACRANRGFLRRAVSFALSQGVRQFIDIGSGIPTVGNVHEVAHKHDPSAAVVYVDNEPVAVAHSEMLLQHNPLAAIVQADLRSPASIVEHDHTRALIDFEEPVMLLMLAMLHFVPDTYRPDEIVQQYRDLLSPGSYFAVTHATAAARPDEMRALESLYATSSTPAVARSPEWIGELFHGMDLVDPGMVFVSEWRLDGTTPNNPQDHIFYGGLGVVPAG